MNHLMNTTEQHTAALLIPSSGKDAISRLSRFARWLDGQKVPWHKPDLDAYAAHLLSDGLSPASVGAHIATIRGQYKRLMDKRDLFFAALPDALLKLPFHEQKAYVDEMIERLAIASKAGKVQTVKKQDRVDSEHTRLTIQQANRLIRKPGTDTLLGLRNTAILALLLATGLREQELCNLTVEDLEQRQNDELVLLVKRGKGCKQRTVPYGDNDSVLPIVKAWLHRAGIASGYVFRGVNQYGDRALLAEKLTTRTIQRILKAYPIVIDGVTRPVKPHDLRRTYARRQFDAGLDIPKIQQNLGHSKIETTIGYIGDFTISERRSKAVFDFDVPLPGALL